MMEENKPININDRIQELAISVQQNSETRDRDYNELCILLMPKLEYYVWRFIKDPHTIKDVVSETFVKMISKLDTFNPEYRFTTWIYKIATNQALGQINATNKRSEVEFTSNINGEMNPNDTLEYYESDFDKLHRLTVEAIFTMPEDINRRIIIEKHINDMKGSDIAEKYDMNENTVKTKLRAMRKKIRDYIKDKDKDLFSKSSSLLYSQESESYYEQNN